MTIYFKFIMISSNLDISILSGSQTEINVDVLLRKSDDPSITIGNKAYIQATPMEISGINVGFGDTLTLVEGYVVFPLKSFASYNIITENPGDYDLILVYTQEENGVSLLDYKSFD